MAGSCDCGNEPSGSIKCGEFLDLLRTGWLLKKDSAPWSMEYITNFVLIPYKSETDQQNASSTAPKIISVSPHSSTR